MSTLKAAVLSDENDNLLAMSKVVNMPFTEFFESTEQTITSAGGLTLAHNLSSTPKLLGLSLVCKVAEHGYSIGDEAVIPVGAYAEWNPAQNSVGTSVIPDATNVNVRFASYANVFVVINKSTGVVAAITLANWKLVVRAWA